MHHPTPGADGYFDEAVAATYDRDSADMFTSAAVDPAVDLLAELAGGGRALEFGVGTGRLALPLAARGVAVAGIELSRAMAARLREKPGGETIDIAIGDFASARLEGTFQLAYLVFNTIMNLTTQDVQVACFQNAAAHLAPGGAFVVEVLVPELRSLPPGQRLRDFYVSDRHWGLDEYDVVGQRQWSHRFRFDEGGVRHASTPFRYVWPAELDLMARLAGMTPVSRWANWRREPFTAESRSHVSVWRKT
jgi:SAM-dependent methyltransferase